MKYAYLFIISLLLLSCQKDAGNMDEVGLSAVQKQVIKGSNTLGFQLLKVSDSLNNGNGNILIAPFNAHMGLACLLNGAEGQTKLQMEQALGLDNISIADINNSHKELVGVLNELPESNELTSINSIWYSTELKPAFKQLSQLYYDAYTKNLDFGSPDAINTINNWASTASNNSINPLLDTINPFANLYLLNVATFNAPWETPFDSSSTRIRTFYLDNGEVVNTPMMYTDKAFPYFTDGEVEFASLPYAGKNVHLGIIMPAGNNGIDKVINSLSVNKWSYWLNSLDTTSSKTLWLPQLRLKGSLSLKESISALGYGVPYDDAADFTGLAETRVKVDEALQKTRLEINENGEYAHITNINSFLPDGNNLSSMVVNRPFLLVIWDQRTGAILFLSRIADPTKQ
ncbi:MAG: serpin family protein [Chitinophagales bacterium]|nr:serpin family protein [Chitinophagales bacterium]